MSCTAAHLRSRSLNIVSLSDMIECSYRSWDLYTTGNGIMSSFLGRQFYRSTLYMTYSCWVKLVLVFWPGLLSVCVWKSRIIFEGRFWFWFVSIIQFQFFFCPILNGSSSPARQTYLCIPFYSRWLLSFLWLIASSLSSYISHLLFFYVLSIFYLKLLVFMTLFCAD